MAEWTGPIAYLNRPTGDGRELAAPEELDTRDLPLPLIATGGPVGSVERVFIDGDTVRAEGSIDDGVLAPGQNTPVGVDVDNLVRGAACSGVFTEWRLCAVHVYLGADERPAWPDAHIRLKDDRTGAEHALQGVDPIKARHLHGGE